MGFRFVGTSTAPSADNRQQVIDIDGSSYDWEGGFDGDTLTGTFSGTFTYDGYDIDFDGSFEVEPK